jgi:hypothetical protein
MKRKVIPWLNGSISQRLGEGGGETGEIRFQCRGLGKGSKIKK